ncbi:MAG: hypothetical protein SFY81_05385 [Verrucomicrobiota bacterium]|nr:hypothetical protein [Verrucomicrobiota bacterium]
MNRILLKLLAGSALILTLTGCGESNSGNAAGSDSGSDGDTHGANSTAQTGGGGYNQDKGSLPAMHDTNAVGANPKQ